MNLVVFNRFGQKIFESSDIYKGWDGEFSKAQHRTRVPTYGNYAIPDVNGDHSLNGYVVLIR